MAQKYDQEAVVRIWRNIKKWGKIPTSHFGHAAVTVRGSLVPGGKDYISFWPGDSAGKGKSAIKAQDGSWNDAPIHDAVSEMNRLTALRLEVGYRQQNGIPYPDHWNTALAEVGKTPITTPRPGQKPTGMTWEAAPGEEYPLWSQSPEAKLNIPGVGATGIYWGLSTRRMSAWWKKFQLTKPSYTALSKQNCAGVALWGLRAGGSEAFVKLPSIHIYAEPVQVEEYAKHLSLQLDRMDQWTREVEQDLNSSVSDGKFKSTEPSKNLTQGLWDSKTWKDESHLGGITVRSSGIRDIDSAVEKYHNADWNEKFPDRYKAMADIMLGIVKHRREKPDSKRSEALLRLAGQIIAMLRNPSPVRY